MTAPAPVVWLWSVGGLGGTERRMVDVAASLRARGIHVDHLLLQTGGPLEASLIARGCEVHSVTPVEAVRFTASLNQGSVVTMGLKAALLANGGKILGGRFRLVMSRAGLDFGKGPVYRLIDRINGLGVDAFLCNSQQVINHLLGVGMPAGRLVLLPPALGCEWFAPVESRPFGAIVAMVGNSRPEKNQVVGLRAFVRSGVEGTLRVYTDDGSVLRDAWAQEEVRPGQTLEVLEGKLLAVADMEAVDLLIHPSVSESLPRAVLEAGARGRSILATPVGALPDYLPAEALLSPLDIDRWAQAIAAEWERPSPNGTPLQREVLSIEQYVNRFLEVIYGGRR